MLVRMAFSSGRVIVCTDGARVSAPSSARLSWSQPMNLVRSVISLFLLVLLAVSVAGWLWAGGLPAPKMMGARLVLVLCGFSSVAALALLWCAKRPEESHRAT